MSADPRRSLPGVDRLLEADPVSGWVGRWGRETVADALRTALDRLRERLSGAGSAEAPEDPAGEVIGLARALLEEWTGPSLRRVLNGTGVVLHTNLGRAPLADEAIRAVSGLAAGYSNLEYDLDSGERGSRYVHCVQLLRRLTGSDSALVVNNNAAAVGLAVHALAEGREVIVSRGELVEIGGSFRMPEVVEAAGGRLVEVGTTNRTRLEDYAGAVGPETGMLLKVHPSNYQVEGFTSSVPLEDLAELGGEHDLPVVHDLGSGLLRPRLLGDLPPEPTPEASAGAGADLVTWSGDKLLGGPQAGIINGRERAVSALREDPMLRAYRVGKMTLAALEATLRLYLEPGRAEEIPALRALSEGAGEVEARAKEALSEVEVPGGLRVRVASLASVVGGGAYPETELPSAGWLVEGAPAEDVARACREGDPPLIGRVADERFCVDFRTILPGQGREAAGRLSQALRAAGGGGGAEGESGR